MKILSLLTIGAVLAFSPARAADLKLDDVIIEDGENGAKTIHVPVINQGDTPVSVNDLKVAFWCYEVKDDKIAAARDVQGEWTSAPDWKDSDTENFDVKYPGPKEAGRTYIGTVVALYYKGKLVDSWSSAPELLKQFPLAEKLVRTENLEQLILPDIDFQQVPLRQALSDLRKVAVLAEPDKRPVNFILKVGEKYEDKLITLSLKQPNLAQAMDEIARQSGTTVEAEKYAVVFRSE